jgi:thiol-disulfide isomerase/thioredoxin
MNRRAPTGAPGTRSARVLPPAPELVGGRTGASRWLLGGAVLAALLVVVVTLAQGRLSGGAGAATATIGQEPAVGTAVGDRAPAFRLTGLDGSVITPASTAGRPYIVWFTTSYCTPCQAGAATLRRLLDRLGAADRVAVVMAFVDPTEPPTALASWKSRFGAPSWIVGFADGDTIRRYQVQYLDTKYLIDGQGLVRMVDYFPLDQGSWQAALATVLQP